MILKLTAVMGTMAVLAVAVAEPGLGKHGHGKHHGGGGGYGHDLGHGHGVHGKDVHYHKPAYYSFKYGVRDDYKGVNFGHEEHRDGYNTKGAYYVHLPDGRIQKVTYTAGKHGYNAHVSYDGYAHHDKGHGGHGHGGHGHQNGHKHGHGHGHAQGGYH